MSGLTVAVLGLGFGAEFVPIYLAHPAVETVVLVEPDATRRAEVAAAYGLAEGHADLEAVLADDTVDAVHVLAPVPFHADYAVAVLQAGKHCACAVPMATSLADCERIIEAERTSGRRYMMMETSVYGREFLLAAELHGSGRTGELTFYRGYHVQNLDGFPSYWQGFPPMHYLTHALSPVLALLDTTVEHVTAHGAGRLAEHRTTGGYDNHFPTEVGLFTLRDSDVVAEIQMSFSQTARSYIEGFSLYGHDLGLEWPADHTGPMLLHRMSGPAPGRRGNQVSTEAVEPPDRGELLIEPLRGFVRPGDVQLPGMAAPVHVRAEHSGSHPFLVAEFLAAVTEQRASAIDAVRAAEWCAPGICAHASAMAGGERVAVPSFG